MWIRALLLSPLTFFFAFASLECSSADPSQPVTPLTAPAGVTAFSGRVAAQNGAALQDIKVADNSIEVRTDDQGRFLLAPVPPDKSVLRIDGRRGGPRHDIDYGVYELHVVARPGQTTILPYTSWLAPIDHSHDVALTSPTTSEVVVRSPAIPYLEIRIPAGVVIRDVDGAVATSVGITVMPADRTPMPMRHGSSDPVFFTIQPGGGCLYDAHGGVGEAQMRYPNFTHELPGARAIALRYAPGRRGWMGYGTATVSADGTQVIPDRGAVITDFASAECDPATRSHMDAATQIDPRRIAP
jgi:hypothetical protein